MSKVELVAYWVPRFLRDHVLLERNLAKNTQKGYRDSLQQLLVFLSQKYRKPIDLLALEDISPDRVKLFLQHLEQDQKNSIATRNQRLAALHAWVRYVGSSHCEYIGWCNEIRAIPFKKASQSPRDYLEKEEMDALLNTPNRATAQGRRDYALMLFMYNTGARADEIAHFSINDLRLEDTPPWANIRGKGSKVRKCPLWPLTLRTLVPLIDGRTSSERVFLNRCQQPITRFGIFAVIKRYATQAAICMPTMLNKQISPHTIRHTTACHLLKAGVDINTVRAWLGHVSIETTNVYAQVDLEMKAKALRHCEIFGRTSTKRWKGKHGVMEFLKSL